MLISNISISQSINKEKKRIFVDRRFAISAKAGGAFWLGGISFDYFICPRLNTNITMAPLLIINNFSGGLKYHPYRIDINTRWSPYTGIEIGWSFFESGFSRTQYRIIAFYVPFGVNYTSEKKLSLLIDIGYLYKNNLTDNETRHMPMGSITIGYRVFAF